MHERGRNFSLSFIIVNRLKTSPILNPMEDREPVFSTPPYSGGLIAGSPGPPPLGAVLNVVTAAFFELLCQGDS